MKIIEVVADKSYLEAVNSVAERHEVEDRWVSREGEDGRLIIRLLVRPEKRQETLDSLQAILENSDTGRIFLVPVEAILPRKEEDEKEKKIPLPPRARSFTTALKKMPASIPRFFCWCSFPRSWSPLACSKTM